MILLICEIRHLFPFHRNQIGTRHMLIMLSLKTEKAEMERARERMEGFRRIGWQESICQEWNIYPNGNGNDVDGRQHQYQPNEM